jgi:hypothetical protein
MKKLIPLLSICFLSVVAFAQKPVEGDMSMTLGLTGLSALNVTTNFGNMSTLLYRYYLADDLALRVRANLTLNNFKTDFSDTTGAGEHDVTKGHFVGLNLGIQKNMGHSKRLEPYIAGDLTVGFGKTGITDNTTDFSDTISQEILTEPGNSTTVGVIANAGFNYYFTDHFAFGAEFGYGLLYTSTGEGETTFTSTTGNTTVTNTSHTGSSKSFGLSGTGGLGLIMITVAF